MLIGFAIVAVLALWIVIRIVEGLLKFFLIAVVILALLLAGVFSSPSAPSEPNSPHQGV